MCVSFAHSYPCCGRISSVARFADGTNASVPAYFDCLLDTCLGAIPRCWLSRRGTNSAHTNYRPRPAANQLARRPRLKRANAERRRPGRILACKSSRRATLPTRARSPSVNSAATSSCQSSARSFVPATHSVRRPFISEKKSLPSFPISASLMSPGSISIPVRRRPSHLRQAAPRR
jgi:hypothetical protein